MGTKQRGGQRSYNLERRSELSAQKKRKGERSQSMAVELANRVQYDTSSTMSTVLCFTMFTCHRNTVLIFTSRPTVARDRVEKQRYSWGVLLDCIFCQNPSSGSFCSGTMRP